MPSEMASRAEEAHLTYIFNNDRPIELVDLTSSLAGARLLRRFALRRLLQPWI